jgi:membrane protein
MLSVVLWLLAARLFASWLAISDYSRFYAGLTRIMSALVFFQVSSLIVILGAEFNRGIVQMKRMLAASGDLESDLSTVPLPPSHESYRLDA